MNIFIGFGYNENDKWIKELVFPLVESFEATILTGEDLHGQVIAKAVEERIKESDGVLAFLTRREAIGNNGYFTTHVWVRDELTTAINHNIPSVEIKENKVDPQGGLPGNRQRIDFDEDNKAKLLVDLSKVLCEWRRKFKARRLFLLPKDIARDARPRIQDGKLECTYQFMDRWKESQVYKTRPFPYGQGICVDIKNIPSEDALVQIALKGPQFFWVSDYESVQLLFITLQKEEDV